MSFIKLPSFLGLKRRNVKCDANKSTIAILCLGAISIHFNIIRKFCSDFVISKSVFSAKSDKVFLALIIGSVFTVSFDLSQGVMCDSAVISNLNIKGKFNVNLISCALKN